MLTRRRGQSAVPLQPGVEFREKNDGTLCRLEWNTKDDLSKVLPHVECGEILLRWPASRDDFAAALIAGFLTIVPSGMRRKTPIKTPFPRTNLSPGTEQPCATLCDDSTISPPTN
jgi:hypothetical protein